MVFKDLGPRRKEIFLASKTHARTREGSLFLSSTPGPAQDRLSRSLAASRPGHAGRPETHLRQGFIEALLQAKKDEPGSPFRHHGHHDPAHPAGGDARFDFDTVLVALNAADIIACLRQTVLPEAPARMGVIAMKVCAAGRLLGPAP